MRFYLSAEKTRCREIQRYATELREVGHSVVSTWHSRVNSEAESVSICAATTRDAANAAQRNWSEIWLSDTLVLFADSNPSRGERHTELGLALALPREVAIVGPRENTFQALSRIWQYDTWDDFVTYHLCNITQKRLIDGHFSDAK